MKRKTLYILLGVEFAALMALVLLTVEFPSLFSSLLAFPFEQIGAGLRTLSLSGGLGNGLALAICVGVSMLPLLLALKHRREKNCARENAVLYCLTLLLLLVLIGMANPTLLYSVFPSMIKEFLPVIKAIMGCTVWSVVVLLLVFRLLRLFNDGNTNKLLGYLRIMLYALCMLFTGVIALSCGGVLVKGISGMQQSMDGVMAAVRFLAAALPYALDIAITLPALTLLDTLLSEDASGAAECANKVSRRCCLALGVTAASVAVLNILQLLLSRWLSDIAVNVDIPITSIAFVLSALLASRLIAENQKLKNNNNLFI